MEAITLCRQNDYDVIIMDVMMRVKVVISRNSNKISETEHDIFRAEGLEIDFTGRTVSVGSFMVFSDRVSGFVLQNDHEK